MLPAPPPDKCFQRTLLVTIKIYKDKRIGHENHAEKTTQRASILLAQISNKTPSSIFIGESQDGKCMHMVYLVSCHYTPDEVANFLNSRSYLDDEVAPLRGRDVALVFEIDPESFGAIGFNALRGWLREPPESFA